MRRFFWVIAILTLALARGASADSPRAAREGAPQDDEQPVERAVAVEPDVAVTLCVGTGDVVVRGWDRREVRARAYVGRVELRQQANPPNAPNLPNPPNRRNVPGPPQPPNFPNPPNPVKAPNPANAPSAPGAQRPARAVEVLMSDSDDEHGLTDCGLSGNVELEVPREATVVLRVREGDVDVSDVAEVRVETMKGDTDVRRATRAVEVESMSGSIFLHDSSGRVRLRTFSGDVEAVNVRAPNGEPFLAKSTDGDVTLEQVRHTHVEAGTVNGDVSMTGALARAGSYDLQTFSGDVTLLLPPGESFKVNARVAVGGEIMTDFAVKSVAGVRPPAGPEPPPGRLVGTVGDGGADVKLSSFNGTLRLRKQ